ncbi:hypothetical protein EB796_015158 [Bugula neritina]|uniref:ATP-dependent RNA helicase n=1 Tax=Bugula neritina TaxID=10212 RepID=A0A7J7JLJ4_BUGNE|nr:hypothetical protein EB796_015158 [Bugula neritina]
MKTHPVFKLTPLSQWKKVPISDAFDSELNPEFGGLEVLENYECTVFRDGEAQSKANEIRSKTKQPVSKPVRQFNNNFKPNRECELEYQSESQGQTEMESESESDPNAASPVKMPKKKKRKIASSKALVLSQTSPSEKPIAGNPKVKRRKVIQNEILNTVIDQEVAEVDGNAMKNKNLLSAMEAWKDLFVPLPVLKSLHELNFLTPTLIQGLTLPSAIRDRLDILGAAETGSGKTLAFGIPVIDKILKLKQAEDSVESRVYALVLTPTRELCVQVKQHLAAAAKYTQLNVVSIFGGLSSQKQVRLLKSRPEIVVATPGRLWDIMNGEEEIEEFLSTIVECPLLVIDEADKMVEKGHFEELTKILNLMKNDEESSKRRQCFVFSATLTYVHLAPDRLKVSKKKKRKKSVKISKESKLNELIETVGILKRPKVIDVTVKSQTASSLVESCIFCTQSEKDLYLYYFLKNHEGRTLIFTNSIDCIRRLLSVFSLLKKTLLPLHASMHQKQRLKNLERFTQSETGILLATDVAARGLDIPNVQHVIHYQVPRTAESYVHRSGRTARALKDGLSVVFVDEKDIQGYKKILKSLHKDDALSPFPVVQEDLKQLKPIVSLAQRIDTTTHRTEKARRHDDWFVKMAKDADLDISDGERSDENSNEQLRKNAKERRQLEKMKMEFASLLAGIDGQSYQGKYPTSSGKLMLPKSMKKNTGSTAITLISKKWK